MTRYFAEGEQRQGSEKFLYARDRLGSVANLVDGSSGEVEGTTTYGPWGQVTSRSGSARASFGYAGMFNGPGTGLNLTLYRAYNPAQYRWLSRDPMGEGAGANLYAYALNNPINDIDPLGLNVFITLYRAVYGFGHIGIGVNTQQTKGLYPSCKCSKALAEGNNVPGEVHGDTQSPFGTVEIVTTPAQDSRVQAFINEASNPGSQLYNFYNNNCAVFVENTLRAGGIDAPNTPLPRELFLNLSWRYNKWQFFKLELGGTLFSPALNPIWGLDTWGFSGPNQ